jgi:hypothetical protein
MSDHLDQDEKQLDDQLAEFVDRVLEPDREAKPGENNLPALSRQDAELRGLQEIVLALKRVIEKDRPDPALVVRIRSRLQAEWPLYQSGRQSETPRRLEKDQKTRRWLDRFFSFPRQRTFAFGFVVATIVLVLAALFVSPVVGIPLSGAAGGEDLWIPLLLILGLAILVGVSWIIRSRH